MSRKNPIVSLLSINHLDLAKRNLFRESVKIASV